MALEATHIRFAIDTKDTFQVKDLDKYISGSIYPDSRYPTGIDRRLTHDDSQLSKTFWKNDDFRKGWASHLLYDKIQFVVHAEWFKDILKEGNPEMTGGEDWIVRTALKILQDIDDLHHFNIKQYLGALDYIETPNNEDEEEVRKYNKLFVDMYSKSPDVDIKDLEQMWTDWGIPTETSSKIIKTTREIQKDKRYMELISKIYEETVKRKSKFYDEYCL